MGDRIIRIDLYACSLRSNHGSIQIKYNADSKVLEIVEKPTNEYTDIEGVTGNSLPEAMKFKVVVESDEEE